MNIILIVTKEHHNNEINYILTFSKMKQKTKNSHSLLLTHCLFLLDKTLVILRNND